MGGTAILKALDKVIAKGKKIAAHLMEAADTDVEFEDGVFKVAGTDKAIHFAQVSLTAYVPHNFPHDKLEPGLNENAFYDPSNFTFPAGSYVCEVEVDRETGATQIARFIAVDDFGKVINPMIVEGQVHGGLAQGIAQALFEEAVHDESGTLTTGTLADYLVPSAADLPSFTTDRTESPATTNPLGVKGVGEAGTIASTPAVVNAVVDAVRQFGINDIQMPCTPMRVWTAIRTGQTDAGGLGKEAGGGLGSIDTSGGAQ